MLEAEDKAKDHGLVKGEGVSSYNYSKNILDDHRFELVRTLITSQVKHFQNGIGIHTKLSLGRSWFNIQRTGSTITAHNHRRSVISGALYLMQPSTSPITFRSHYTLTKCQSLQTYDPQLQLRIIMLLQRQVS